MIKLEIMTLRSMLASARPEIAEAAGNRMLKLQDELELLEKQNQTQKKGRNPAPPFQAPEAVPNT